MKRKQRRWKTLTFVVLLIFPILACYAPSMLFDSEDEPAAPSDFGNDEYYIQLTATFQAVETLITEATATSAAKTQEASQGSSDDFCEIYSEFVYDAWNRVNEYEAIVASGGDAGDLPEQLDLSIDTYMDRLVVTAPAYIRPTVEQAAAISFLGTFSSQAGNAQAEALLQQIDNFASTECGISLNDGN